MKRRPRRTGLGGKSRLRHVLIAVAVAACCTRSAAESGREIPLVRDGGVLKAPVVINRQLVKLFIIDSGSSDVQVHPAETCQYILHQHSRWRPAPGHTPPV
jgi:hypothetical protein